MSDETAAFWLGFIVAVVALMLVLDATGGPVGQRECRIHLSYALTEADTLTTLKAHEYCEKYHKWEGDDG